MTTCWLILLAERLGVAPGDDATPETALAALQHAAAFAWQSGVRLLTPADLLAMEPASREVWHATVQTGETTAALDAAARAANPVAAGVAAVRTLFGVEAAAGVAMEIHARRERDAAALAAKLKEAVDGE